VSETAQRYTAVAIILHWAIALAIAGMIALGWWMGDALEDSDTQAQAIAAFQLHKSVGLTVLALSLARLAWRLVHKPPPFPEAMKPWEKTVAAATHWAFYVLIIAMPLTGWLYVSTAWSPQDDRPLDVPTLYFGLFHVPHLFGLSNLAEDARAAVAEVFEFSHSKLAWGAIGLTVLHIGAALKHHFVNRDGVLARMVPGLDRSAPTAQARALALAGGFAAIALAAAGALWAFQNPPSGAAAPPAAITQGRNSDEAGRADNEDAAPAQGEGHGADDRSDAATPAAAPAAGGAPSAWTVDRAASSIAFSGTHAGIAFEGRFRVWRADIRFDPNDLERSSASVTIETGSASDGVALHDQTLTGGEWFDVANHPNASFRTTSIRARGGNAYEARGTLTIKGRPMEARLPFTLTISGGRATMDGALSIDRRDANLGMASDPDAEYVSREIAVRVHVEATRAR
jgi:cytochrome b561/polyisoprenoid-binding protein YceI